MSLLEKFFLNIFFKTKKNYKLAA